MDPQKTEAELKKEQEEADAAMARQLQAEMDAERASAAPPSRPEQRPPAGQPQQAPTMNNGVLTVACPACTFLNEIPNAVSGRKYACKQCSTPLPLPSNLSERKEPRMVQCNTCHSINRVPDRKADAALCGACYQQLGSSVEDPPAAATAPHAPTPETRTVQIRCGQCSAVNAVHVASDAKVMQFECGGCSTINEVNLS